MGSTAVLVEDPPGGPAAWANAFGRLDVAGVVDIVPAARTVLVRCRRPHHLVAAVEQFEQVFVDEHREEFGHHVRIPVVYDGKDLDAVAGAAGLTTDEVIKIHVAARYRVAFCGFAPGFAYLSGLPEILHLPRRDTPRMRVPPGSVAIATEYSAIYPAASPGGWHLLGHTVTTVFDPDRRPPALLRPGTIVHFEAR